jgi:glutamate synthase (NADPH/NADH) large chain
VLDRNGLRPARYWVTEDGLVVLSSEVGVLDIDPATVVRKGRLQPAACSWSTRSTAARRRRGDQGGARGRQPVRRVAARGLMHLQDLPEREHVVHTHASVTRRQQTFGYTEEELRVLISPMAKQGAEAIGSMGTDTPVAVLSQRPRLLFDYFSQLFAQVTNPPLDAIREELVTSLAGSIGPEQNLLEPSAASCRQIVLPFPVLSNDDLSKIVHVNEDGDLPGFSSVTVHGLYPVNGGGRRCATRWTGSAARCRPPSPPAPGSSCCPTGTRPSTWRPSRRCCSPRRAPPPDPYEARTQVGSARRGRRRPRGPPRRAAHRVRRRRGQPVPRDGVGRGPRRAASSPASPDQAVRNLVKALGKGVLKVMSKMGISTVASYRGAQVFEAIGLSQDLVDRYFTGTTSRLGGIGLDVSRRGVAPAPRGLPPGGGGCRTAAGVGGEYQWRRDGRAAPVRPRDGVPAPALDPHRRYDVFRQYTARVDDQSAADDAARAVRPAHRRAPAVPLEEVEPVSAIVKRFSTGAMSYGSISQEAHETLAVAMNRLGGKSNTGEGGEDADRLHDPARAAP